MNWASLSSRAASYLRMAVFMAAIPVFGEDAFTPLWEQAQNAIRLDVGKKNISGHKDHFAMSGRSVDLIMEWEITDQQEISITRWVRWPMLRTIPNNTHASYNYRFQTAKEETPFIEGKRLSAGKVEYVEINGTFIVLSRHTEGVETTRKIYPSSSGPAVIDLVEIKNTSDKVLSLNIPEWSASFESKKGTRGAYTVTQYTIGAGEYTLAPGETRNYGVIRTARNPEEAPYVDEPYYELAARNQFLEEMRSNLILETPSPVLNQMFEFAKIRGTESIFSTRGGLMHGPGGYHLFLAAMWTNDQVEYINPFFPYLGNKLGNESAMNCYRWFAKYMNDEYKPIPSSIIAEGEGYWNGAGDRGEQAMSAYGAGRFLLAAGNKEWAKELMPFIDWCIEYCHRNRLPEGVVASDTDELEKRFPSGKANLITSTLYYDALISAAYLWKELDPSSEKVELYLNRSTEMREAILKYFRGTVEGYDTYKYYEGNEILRSWICMPMVVGINENASETTNALLSDKLWFGNGMLTASNTKTYWDRSTLYGFRGIFKAGLQDRVLPKLLDYSRERLLGSHVPYAIEAYPEGNKSHLSAESGLYCSIFIEGLFGINPTGFRTFEITPRLPKEWNHTSLKNIKAYGSTFNIALERKGEGVQVLVTDYNGKELYKKTSTEKDEKHLISLPR